MEKNNVLESKLEKKPLEKSRLGRGLSSLIPPSAKIAGTPPVQAEEAPAAPPAPLQAVPEPAAASEDLVQQIAVDKIIANTYQPRSLPAVAGPIRLDPSGACASARQVSVYGGVCPQPPAPAFGDAGQHSERPAFHGARQSAAVCAGLRPPLCPMVSDAFREPKRRRSAETGNGRTGGCGEKPF